MIRRVRADQWERLRDLRLAALRDSPISYLETEQAALARPEEDWRDWAARGAAGDRLALYVAELDDGRWAGMCGVFVDDDPRIAQIAEALIAAAARWAAEQAGAGELRLFVHEDNARAWAFYRRLGFTETGHTIPCDPDSTRAEIEMARLAVTPPA